nr:UDP-N-acetylmuramoyl-L-alanyl-D-glutamate--2,6-diaminopimelate ligase [candidate division Zixibacteria bacterium]
MILKELISTGSNLELTGDGTIEITGLDYDSRRIRPGMLFVAIAGYRQDGNRFIPDAIQNGAAAILTEKPIDLDIPVVVTSSIRKTMAAMAACFYDYPGLKIAATAVTGTNGKSTSVALIANLLRTAGKKVGMMNSLVYDTGTRQYKAERTTPDSIDTQKMMAEMVGAGCTEGVIEVSSHALVLHRVDHIDFKVGLFTNFSRDHLDFHNTMEEYLAAKKLLLDILTGPGRWAVINVDVPEYAGFIPDVKGRCLTWSLHDAGADVYVEKADLYPDRTVFDIRTASGCDTITIRLPGRYNLENAAGAAAAGVALGLGQNIIKTGLESAQPVMGRFQPVDLGQPFTVIIDFAHTPDALKRLIASAREISRGRILTLFGCGGDRDKGKRPLMGRVVTENSDVAVVTSDNPRKEDAGKIIEDILPGMSGKNYEIRVDRKEAIARILSLARPYDMVLIAGKGAEDYQEIGTKKYPYQDQVEIIRVLESLGYSQGCRS